MPKAAKTAYICQSCGAAFPKWAGQCGDCGSWNSLIEEVIQSQIKSRRNFVSDSSALTSLNDVKINQETRFPTTSKELDRTLGGGLVSGSVVLIGGDPGIGKSTLLLQVLSHMQTSCLYVTGEESLQQIALRAKRLKLQEQKLNVLTETQVERILAIAQSAKPQIMVVDSIQTMSSELVQSAPGSVSQVRESAAQFVQYAKQTGTALILVGHVTKEGTIAGPRVLEHMVDTVLYFEGDKNERFRIVRAVKNRFGAVNELGIFAMTDEGLREVTNPSSIFLSRYEKPMAGSAVMATWEGSRPILVEVQALVDETQLTFPRRVAIGFDPNRLAMLLAVLHRHGEIATYNQDVFINVVGGIRVVETAIDLAMVLAVVSSLKNKPLPTDLLVLGELGLAGEIRPVQNGQERLKEAVRHGFKQALVPKANLPKKSISGMRVQGLEYLREALAYFRENAE